MYYGALEAGGTKMVCAVVDENCKIMDRSVIPTKLPDVTVNEIIQYFENMNKQYKLQSIGVAAFGPVELDEKSERFGTILDTPKQGWSFYPLYQTLYDALRIPIKLDTDVNVACLGEMMYGNAKGILDVVYITIGTGIGAGIAVDGKLVHGMLHPEAGHIGIMTMKGDEGNCVCPFHTSCFEGLASGPSIYNRYGKYASELYDDDAVWKLEAEYIAQALVNYIMILSPKKIILGGGVMHQDALFDFIRQKVLIKINGYLKTEQLADINNYIVPAGLSDDQGIIGCYCLAKLG